MVCGWVDLSPTESKERGGRGWEGTQHFISHNYGNSLAIQRNGRGFFYIAMCLTVHQMEEKRN